MTSAVLTSGFLAYASYHPKAPPNNVPWDTLYVVAGLVGIVLVVIMGATLVNRWEDRRH